MPDFTQDWFSEVTPIFKEVLKDFIGKDNITALEIGSYEGRSAIWFLENVLTGNNCGIICIDDFGGVRLQKDLNLVTNHVKNRFLNNMKPYEGKYQLLEGKSQDILRNHDYREMIDIVYVDGSHRADDTMIDLINALHILRPGGVLFVDDYLWNYYRYPAHETPKPAVDAFSEIFKDHIEIKLISYKTVVFKKNG